MQRGWARAVVGLALLVGFPGCAGLLPDRDMPPGVAIDQAIAHRHDDALSLLRSEIASPALSDALYGASVRAMAIETLADVVKDRPHTPELDAEALGYFEQGRQLSGNDRSHEARLLRAMTLYFSASERNGRALPYLRAELELWEEVDDAFRLFGVCFSMAKVYDDIGETALGRYYDEQAQRHADRYFLGDGPRPDEWVEYQDFLLSRMRGAAGAGAADAIRALWRTLEPINARYVTPEYPAYLETAQLLAWAGDERGARRLLQQAGAFWRAGEWRSFEVDSTCATAVVDLHTRRYPSAARGARRCERMKRLVELRPKAIDHQLWAQSYEGNGEFDEATRHYWESIDGWELLRSTYEVSARAPFFRTGVRRSYWGLIRVLLGRDRFGETPETVLHALRVGEMVRARQLGELLGERARITTFPDSLESVRNGLARDELLLSLLVMPDEYMGDRIALVAVTREATRARLIDLDVGFDARVGRLAAGLSGPSTSTALIERLATDIGQTILGPVRDLLATTRRVVILSDGVLNTIPLELLRPRVGDAPLIDTHETSLAPSLRFLLSARRARPERPTGSRLFAVADPRYPSRIEVAGLSEATLRSATGGEAFKAFFAPLPETRSEVESIIRLFGRDQVDSALGDRALESRIKAMDLSRYGYLHFATHGVLGNEVPGIGEPAIVLGAEIEEDGFLTATEAASLELDAELTVLSACNTGSGVYYPGEGIMGMSRAFLVAGSKAVVVSLWSVDSKATAELMVLFYEHMREGMPAARALREAKRQLRSTRPPGGGGDRGLQVSDDPSETTAGRHPFYWSGFVLFGG